MAEDQRSGEEGPVASTSQNRIAGRVLKLARLSMEDGSAKQAAFASRLSRGLGVEISVARLSNWETGRRTVPMAVVLEAAAASEKSIDGLLGETGDPAIVGWATGLGLPSRLQNLEDHHEQQMAEMVALRKEIKDGIAQLRHETSGLDLRLRELAGRTGQARGRHVSELHRRTGSEG